MSSERDYEVLADLAERGELHPVPGTRLVGEDAAAAGRALLMRVTGAATVEEAGQLALGRPKVGQDHPGPSKPRQVRLPKAMDDDLKKLADRRGVTVSVVLREAVAEKLARAS